MTSYLNVLKNNTLYNMSSTVYRHYAILNNILKIIPTFYKISGNNLKDKSTIYIGCSIYTNLSEKKVKVTQSCLTLCNPMDCTVHGILQTRIMEWVAIPLGFY